MKSYTKPLIIGEDRDLTNPIDEVDDEAFTITTAELSIYDINKTLVYGPIDNDAAAFDIDGSTMLCQVDCNDTDFSAGWHIAVWEYISGGQTFIDKFWLGVETAP